MDYEKPQFNFKLKFFTKTTPGWKRKLTDKELEALKHLPAGTALIGLAGPDKIPYESAYTRKGDKPSEKLMEDASEDL